MPYAAPRAARPRRGALAAVLAAGLLGTTVLAPALLALPPAAADVLRVEELAAPVVEAGYPRRTVLPEPAPDPGDAALRLGLTPYSDIARRLNAAQAGSDRVSTEVVATTATGREVVLVTLTAPESLAQARQQATMRDRVTRLPAQAARDRGLARSYKVPVFLNANIHGNEYEGTDAALRLVEDYATSQDPEVLETLERSRIHLVVSMNPDGRHDGTRRNSAGFDLNRDLVTATQPEVVGVRDAIVRTQPVLLLDLHGYVNGTLVEPTTPPHGENYEYDLVVEHAYPNALGMEEAIRALGHDRADGVEPTQIPLRDWSEGWDDWPPIFTPQYAALHGAVAHTVEVPLRVNNSASSLPETELRRRAAINTDIAHAAMTASLDYVREHRAELLAGQIEIFRRGVDGAPQTPVEEGLFGLIGPEDVYLGDYPRAYVVPVGAGQRSAPAAARLVDHLVANGVEVTRLTRPASIAGQTYPAGSYLVDLHQARRGMANTILGAGTDISERVEAMYDIAGWSHGLLWGADVVTVPEGVRLSVVGQEVDAAAASGSLALSSAGWRLELEDPADVRALVDLLSAGVQVELLDDGAVLVPAGDVAAAQAVVAEHGVALAPAPAGAAGDPMGPLTVGVAGTAEELWAFGELGLDVVPVTSAALDAGLDLEGVDALYVSSGLSWRDLGALGRAELESFLEDGGGVVGRGGTGAGLNDALGLLDVDAVVGRGDANGVVAVDNADSPVTAGATPHTFVYAPLWFTDLGPGVEADQTYAADPLVSGHWRADVDGRGGPDAAAGQAVVVRGTDAETGARVVLMGSEPLFRAHPKGQYALVARALLWSSLG
ncbi:M14 family zinc carboxypeptidase [Ornithinimicrobium cerasi]|uniref:M14 family zinc carboxypeptidase n=1 Tax=Ornithinimicrobium cerasi TaxID=2248773 RepID=UPI00192A58E2|nr:M14 family zinc carboxypeptidase [Ornithinimicrobium cerasi]